MSAPLFARDRTSLEVPHLSSCNPHVPLLMPLDHATGEPWSIWRQPGVGLELDSLGELFLLPPTAAKKEKV